MKTKLNHYSILLLGMFMLIPIGLSAQQLVKQYPLNKEGKVLISASSSDVQIEYWDKSYVQVDAQIEGDYSEKEKTDLLKLWGVQTKGDKEVVIISAGASQWKGVRRDEFIWKEDGKAYEIITPNVVVPPVSPIPPAPPIPPIPPVEPVIADLHVNIPKIPELPKIPVWPFSDKDDISVKMGTDVMKGSINHYFKVDFDKMAYENDKKAYLAKLNKKFGTKVTEKQVDQWLEKVDQWMVVIESTMEDWSKDIEVQMDEKFGPEFQAKMEEWGEQFGEEFGEKMEEWGEQFGKKMEVWAEQFEEDFAPKMEALGKEIEEKLAPEIEKMAEELAERFESDDNSREKRTARVEARTKELRERMMNRAIQIKERAEQRKKEAEASKEKIVVRRFNSSDRVFAFRHQSADSNDKKLLIKVPNNAEVELDVRYGSLNLKNAQNIQAHLNYTNLNADTISGDATQIEASQTKISVDHWQSGSLHLNFVNDCEIKKVKNLSLNANTSDVIIGSIEENAWLNGSFGHLKIDEVADQFKSIELTLENTEASLSMPNSSFDLYYRGVHSKWNPSSDLTLDKTSMGNQEIIKGYHKSSSNKRSIQINARYSDFVLN